MKKIILIFLGIIAGSLFIWKVGYATSGACSSHGGVDCGRGMQPNGMVYCIDNNWKESTVLYDYMKMCRTNLTPNYCAESYTVDYSKYSNEKLASFSEFTAILDNELNTLLNYDDVNNNYLQAQNNYNNSQQRVNEVVNESNLTATHIETSRNLLYDELYELQKSNPTDAQRKSNIEQELIELTKLYSLKVKSYDRIYNQINNELLFQLNSARDTYNLLLAKKYCMERYAMEDYLRNLKSFVNEPILKKCGMNSSLNSEGNCVCTSNYDWADPSNSNNFDCNLIIIQEAILEPLPSLNARESELNNITTPTQNIILSPKQKTSTPFFVRIFNWFKNIFSK